MSHKSLALLLAVAEVSETGIDISTDTKKEFSKQAQSILSVNRAQWLEPLNRMVVGPHVATALETLFQTRLLGYIMPELYPVTMRQRHQILVTKDLWYHTKMVTAHAINDLVVRWAALLHDIAKPYTYFEDLLTNEVHFYQHEFLGARLAQVTLAGLQVPYTTRRSIVGLIAMHQRIGDVVSRKNDPPVSMNALRRLTRDCENKFCKIEDLVELFAADCTSGRTDVQERQRAHTKLLREAVAKMREEDAKPRLPKGMGDILMSKYNLSPGPAVGRLMADLNTLLQKGEITPSSSIEEMLTKLEKMTDEDL
jgi:poly(A) polymerase